MHTAANRVPIPPLIIFIPPGKRLGRLCPRLMGPSWSTPVYWLFHTYPNRPLRDPPQVPPLGWSRGFPIRHLRNPGFVRFPLLRRLDLAFQTDFSTTAWQCPFKEVLSRYFSITSKKLKWLSHRHKPTDNGLVLLPETNGVPRGRVQRVRTPL